MQPRTVAVLVSAFLCGSLLSVEASDARPLVELLKIIPLVNGSVATGQAPAEQIPINLPPLQENVQNIPEINYIDFLKLTAAKRTSSDSTAEYGNVFHRIYKKFKPSDVHKILEQLVQFIKELKKLNVDLYPREFFAREQAMLFAQDLYVKLKVAEFSGGRFREGVENLYYLAHKLGAIDSTAAKLLEDLMTRTIRIMELILNEGETSNGLRATDWNAVIATLEAHGKQRRLIGKPIVGKIGHLQLDKILGAGGFGVVYKAWLGNSVCTMKLVPTAQMPSAKHAIMDKMVASIINHPCLVKYHATFAAEGAFVTIMEYIRGVDLSKLLRVVSYFPLIVLKVIIAQLGVAIQHLHFNGFIHRDIKPENLMILPGCRIKLIDFDTAKACIGKFHNKMMPSYYHRTKLEFVQPEMAGTYPYTPPEGFTHKGYGRTMDWWALGVVTYQLATGRLPFYSDNPEVLQSQITSAVFSWPLGRDFEPDLKYLVNACLRINPKFRLCSRHYSDFQRHPFFKGTDWAAIETAPVLIHYDPIHEVYAQELSFKTSLQQELLTPTVALADLEKNQARARELAAAAKAKTDPEKKSHAKDKPVAVAPKTAIPSTTPSGKTKPIKNSPKKSSPAKDSPKKSSPTKKSPKKSSPTKTVPEKPKPTKTPPKKSSPTKLPPKENSPKATKSTKTSPGKPRPSKTSPKKSILAQSPPKKENSDEKSPKTAKPDEDSRTADEASEGTSKKSEPAQTPVEEAPAAPPQQDQAPAPQKPHVYHMMGQISPSSSPTTEYKKQRLFGNLTQINDLDDQVNIYTYSSWAFSRAMEALNRGEMPDSNALHEQPDRVVTEDDKQHPYAFEAFLKNEAVNQQ